MKLFNFVVVAMTATLAMGQGAAATCVDDDARMATLAANAGFPQIQSCLDILAANACNHAQHGDLIQSVCCASCSPPTCVDDDTAIATLAAQVGYPDISGCVDVIPYCQTFPAVQEHCCDSCAASGDVPENELPDTSTSGDTVKVFLLAGQSECVGQGRVQDLDQDATTYPELQGDQSGVWFAGYKEPADADRFFLRPMNMGDARMQFGPEVSFGQRYHEASNGEKTLVVKYCVGGTSVSQNWNPTTAENSWDKTNDNGTAQWMVDNAGLNFQSKNHMFKNMIYTIRKTQETLTSGGVNFEWAGIVWVQGMADKDFGTPVWKAFGENTARVWEGFRDEIGSHVPIIDTGASSTNQLKSGKQYATQIVPGCHAKNVDPSAVSNDETGTCVVTPNNSCMGQDGFYSNTAVFERYGYDPNWPAELTPTGAETFHWYASFPSNLHSAYEGMILKGRMLANAFILEFTDFGLDAAFVEDDIYLSFPWNKCADGALPVADNLCWIDHRDAAALAITTCQST